MGNVPRRRLRVHTAPKVEVPTVRVVGLDLDGIPEFLRRYTCPVHTLPKRLQQLYAEGKLPKEQYVVV